MPQAHFAYSSVRDSGASDAAGLPLGLSVFADRVHLRDEMRDDAQSAGFRIMRTDGIASLLEGEARPLGEVVLLDCPVIDGSMLAALARLDLRAANSGAQLVVSTTVEALDDVFACMDQSNPQFLVDPSRAERVIALGRVLAKVPQLRLRELTETDRLMLLRLTEQVAQIAERLDRLSGPTHGHGPDSAFRFEAFKRDFAHPPANPIGGPIAPSAEDEGARATRQTRPPLPDPRLLRRILRQRQLRGRFFDGELFADPAWDMLLDLTAARVEHKRVSVTSLCIASCVPPTTALRWIGQLTEAGLIERVEDDTDRRRAFLVLTDRAADAMARYFLELDANASRLI
ncbi:MAG: MarR family transcriptional regulator [Novosphingobium sp.]|nr:MAG: MarR family transcriptional regulator [Novosphingobium sp.]